MGSCYDLMMGCGGYSILNCLGSPQYQEICATRCFYYTVTDPRAIGLKLFKSHRGPGDRSNSKLKWAPIEQT